VSIFVTGSEGLIGSCLVARLRSEGHRVTTFDLRNGEDICDEAKLRRALENQDRLVGIIHLAAVSRVVWTERDPTLCWKTNVVALQGLLRLAATLRRRPWIIFASSREVYGQPARLPANEEVPLAPVNIYGRSKQEGERLCKESGLRVGIVRLSNVYGSVKDHPDRVIPAFVHAALAGEPLRVDGPDSTFDFVHVEDAVTGMMRVAALLSRGDKVAPVHLVTGVPTTLVQLAERIVFETKSSSETMIAEPRTFDVERFYGDRSRAMALLDWEPMVGLETGLKRLIDGVRKGS
jgi:UDP-glucose 4-epimerase